MIREQPTADVREIVKGKWTTGYEKCAPGFLKEKYLCSVCGRWSFSGRTAFCPQCGADMRGDGHE